MAQLQIVKSAAALPIFSPMLDEDQLLHVKNPASGCRVLATHGPCNACEGGKSATCSGQEFLVLCDEVDSVDLFCSLEQEETLACSVHRSLLAEVFVHMGRPGGVSTDIRPLSFVHLPPVWRGAPTVFSAA